MMLYLAIGGIAMIPAPVPQVAKPMAVPLRLLKKREQLVLAGRKRAPKPKPFNTPYKSKKVQ